MQRLKNFIFPALLVLLLGVLHATWTWRDQSYQENDAGFYMQHAQEIYLVGKHKGVLEMASFAYLYRTWKPILGQDLIVPFLFLTHGDTKEAFRIYTAVSSAAVVIGLYFLFMALSGSALLSFLATVLMMFSAWMMLAFLEFGSETPWLWSSIWFLYFLVKDSKGQLRAPRWPATGMLLISVLCRPVESTFCLVIPYLIWLLFPLRRDRPVLRFNALWIAGELAVALTLILFPYFVIDQDYPSAWQRILLAALTVYCVAKAVWFQKKRPATEATIQLQWTLLVFAVITWFLPGLHQLMSWALGSTFGRNVDGSYFFGFVKYNFALLFVARMGIVFFAPLLLLVWMRDEAIAYWQDRRPLLYFLLWTALAFATICSLTSSRDFRYYQISFVAIWTLIFATLTGPNLPRINRGLAPLLGTLIVIMLWGVLPSFFNEKDMRPLPYWDWLKPLTGDHSRIHARQEDEKFYTIFRYLKSQQLPDNIHFRLILPDENELMSPYNPWKLTLALRETGKFWDLQTYRAERSPTFEKIEDQIADIFKQAEAILVMPPVQDGDPQQTSQHNRISKALQKCFMQPCPEYRLKFHSGFLIKDERAKTTVPILLFTSEDIRRRDHELFTTYGDFKKSR